MYPCGGVVPLGNGGLVIVSGYCVRFTRIVPVSSRRFPTPVGPVADLAAAPKASQTVSLPVLPCSGRFKVPEAGGR
jgi:hypothetical protein